MRRFGFSSAVALFILALVAAPSWACVNPGISVSPNPVHPGDSVSFNIINLTADPDHPVQWTIKLGNGESFSRSATSGTYTGTFPAPEPAPSSTTVSVELIVEHGDIETADQTTSATAHPGIQYAGTTSAAEPTTQSSPTGSAPAGQQAQQNGSATSAPPSNATGQVESAGPSSPHGSGPTAARPRTPARQGSRVVERHSGTTPPRTQAALPVPGRASAPAHFTPAVAAAVASPHPATHGQRSHRASPALATHVRTRPPVAASVEPVATRAHAPAEERAVSPPWAAIAALGALAAIAFLRWRRGRGDTWSTAPPPPAAPPDAMADPRDLAIEAELKDLIAEENARRRDVPAAVP